MKNKLKVYYTVQYVKEVELEIDKKVEEYFKYYNYLDNLEGDNLLFLHLQEKNYNTLEGLPIPDTENSFNEQSEYVDDSFKIDYFAE